MGKILLALLCLSGIAFAQNDCVRYFWKRSVIIKTLQRLKRDGIALNSGALQRNQSQEIGDSIERAIGRRSTGGSLHRAILRNFESYDVALKEAGIEVNEVALNSKFTKDLIVKAIQALYRAQISLHPRTLAHDFTDETKKLIKESSGLNGTGALLYKKSIRYFGSYRIALSNAGVDPVTQNIHFDRQSVHEHLGAFIDDQRLTVISNQMGVYEELRLKELSDVLQVCTEMLPENMREGAYAFLDQAYLEGQFDENYSYYFQECLKMVKFEY
jgi:hypothetical protein